MSTSDFISVIFFPLFFVSAVVWLCCVLFFRNKIPQGRFIRTPFLLAKQGGLFGWVGAISSGGLILSLLIVIVIQFLGFFGAGSR